MGAEPGSRCGREDADAGPRRERAIDAGGAWDSYGHVAAPVLVPYRRQGRSGRQSGQGDQAPRRRSGAVSRPARPAWTDRRALSPPSGIDALRYSRGGRPPVLLPRLDVRQPGALPRDAGRASRKQLKDRVRTLAYPVEELGGLVFAYLGPEPTPLLPRWDLLVMDNVWRDIGVTVIPCNWMQCMENSLDPDVAP